MKLGDIYKKVYIVEQFRIAAREIRTLYYLTGKEEYKKLAEEIFKEGYEFSEKI